MIAIFLCYILVRFKEKGIVYFLKTLVRYALLDPFLLKGLYGELGFKKLQLYCVC